ncbi:GAF domain-containing sensor histidine kinase [Pleurocapsa sp. PCC 7319]|uniref:GAF domain-containing sensor histidine kinase n=1 Tax=Pleurocapsa sp. PCC 7319 TaxID=118161 RepID=UPI00036A31E1|nr:GAF domain-containing sensor histidine kinase [Pleurocapsa sp. PCC 7319]
MTKPKNRLFCRLDGLTPSAREQARLSALCKLGLLVSEAVPIFEEATQKAASFSGAPICILGLVVEDELWFKSAVGLSTTGLMNQLAAQRTITLNESFSNYVIDSEQPLVIDNTLSDAVFANSVLTQHYGIRAYLGVPLITSAGLCIGTLEVMDWETRQFHDRDVEHLALLARWCLGEFERNQMLKTLPEISTANSKKPEWQNTNSLILNRDLSSSLPRLAADNGSKSTLIEQTSTQRTIEQNSDYTIATANPIKIKLLSQLTQELRTPLTSVIGMASVLHREVYGPLTLKQREYLEIIHDSGQNLISLVDEIVSLGVLNEQDTTVHYASVDIEMLCQQVINSLMDTAKQHQQILHLSIEPGNRIWSLDKEKVKQALYYLITSVLEMSEAGGEIKVHVSRRNKALNIAVGVSHPWLGEGFAEVNLHSQAITKALTLSQADSNSHHHNSFNAGMSDISLSNHQVLTSSSLMMLIDQGDTLDKETNKIPRDILGLLFCCHLTELHEGQVVVQGSPNSSYRYVLQLPKAHSEEE